MLPRGAFNPGGSVYGRYIRQSRSAGTKKPILEKPVLEKRKTGFNRFLTVL
jgi:hypothetical protein